jgi:nicotinate phosphoribosyltransferase
MKLSKGKVTLPGKKQIFRQKNSKGKYVKDIIGLEDENIGGERLLRKVMQNGQIICEMPMLEEIRKTALVNLSELPERYKRLRRAPSFPVELSQELTRITARLTTQLKH